LPYLIKCFKKCWKFLNKDDGDDRSLKNHIEMNAESPLITPLIDTDDESLIPLKDDDDAEEKEDNSEQDHKEEFNDQSHMVTL